MYFIISKWPSYEENLFMYFWSMWHHWLQYKSRWHHTFWKMVPEEVEYIFWNVCNEICKSEETRNSSYTYLIVKAKTHIHLSWKKVFSKLLNPFYLLPEAKLSHVWACWSNKPGRQFCFHLRKTSTLLRTIHNEHLVISIKSIGKPITNELFLKDILAGGPQLQLHSSQ